MRSPDDSIARRTKTPDEWNLRLLELLLELLRSAESLPDMAVVGVWTACTMACYGRRAVARHAFANGIFDLGTAHLRVVEPTDRVVHMNPAPCSKCHAWIVQSASP